MRVKPSSRLTLHDKLSRLTIVQAQKLLGPRGAHWLAVTLPGMQSLDALAAALAKLMATRESGNGSEAGTA